MNSWPGGGVMYQIYPQSFADSNADGIGDLAGIESRLEYLQWLGVDTVWLNPCFVSPMRDAGYDVSDFLTISPRYGTEEDLVRLVGAASERGIRVLLDLVAGHTSDEHPWFTAAAADPADDRYIWSDNPAAGFVASPGSRPGFYLPNFFSFQPALNYGYARPHPGEPWRQPPGAPGPEKNVAALREAMSFWLDRGVGGFRVDMAFSLVKDDPGWAETSNLWRGMRSWLDDAHPGAVLAAEWGNPQAAIDAGFHADFFLHMNGTAFRSLFDTRGQVPCYFDAGAAGTPQDFAAEYAAAARHVGSRGVIGLPTSNHDFPRLVCDTRTAAQAKAAMVFVLMWPTMPVLFQGDEIGMRFLPEVPAVEGALTDTGTNRAGSRTPMQWDTGHAAGFSHAPLDKLYLPIDPDPSRQTVAEQRDDEASLLHLVRRLIALRRSHPELATGGPVAVLHAGYPLIFRRGPFTIAVNPGAAPAEAAVPEPGGLVLGQGVTAAAGRIVADGFSWAVFRDG